MIVYLLVYIGENNISGAFKKEFDTLGEERGIRIKIDELRKGMNFHDEVLMMMQSLRAPHVEGQGEGGEEG